MKTIYFVFAISFFISIHATGQEEQPLTPVNNDTAVIKNLDEVIISALRIEVPLRQIPAAISVVSRTQINVMPKVVGADDALRLVPGVRVDNGTGGSRVHVYIRGQGVLTESGFRGIGVYIDGISVNSPGGFAPDLYDADWETVSHVEVVKGLAASLYGAGSTGGVINITTKNGGEKPFNSSFYASAGSNGFWKILGQADGTQKKINYRISYSHMQGHGYRVHQAYMADNLSEKLTWTPSEKIEVTQLLMYTNYFNQNSEGINLSRYDTVGHTAANTDAVRYNEFHLTQRLTGATGIRYNLSKNQDITFRGFVRMNNYQETSNNGDDFKPNVNPGISAQYNLQFGKEGLFNHLGLGADYQSMKMTEHMFAVPDGDHINSNRADSYWSQEVFDLNTVLINQVIRQRSAGLFLVDKLDIAKKLYATINVRYDYVYSRLDSSTVSESKVFQKPTFRLGLAYDLSRAANIYASYGSGFLVPTEDELYNNPVKYGGVDSTIKPSNSMGCELGARGEIGQTFYYDITGFSIITRDELYRYSIPERGNNTAFYGNMGKSKRWGIEMYLSHSPFDFLKIDAAYTYSHFRYTSPDSVSGHWIPQSPEHMLTAEAALHFPGNKILRHFTLTVNLQFASMWQIQVDDSIYFNYHEYGGKYTVTRSSTGRTGFTVANANLKYTWKLGSVYGDVSFFCKNLFDEQYFGFTEPNNGPDYNSYQAAPGREFFMSLRFRL